MVTHWIRVTQEVKLLLESTLTMILFPLQEKQFSTIPEHCVYLQPEKYLKIPMG